MNTCSNQEVTAVKLQRAFVVTGVAVTVLYMLIPYGPTASWSYLILSTSVAIAIVAGVLINKPAMRAPWVVLAVAFALSAVGDGFWTYYALARYGDVPFPNLGDLAYLAFYPLAVIALAMFVRASAQHNPAAWLDAMIWTVGSVMLAWEPLLEPYTTGGGATTFAGLVAVAYPLMDIVLLLMLVRLFVGGSERSQAFWLMMAGLCLQTAADLLFDLQMFGDNLLASHLTDAGWLLAFVAIGGAALHPSMVRMTNPLAAPPALSSRRRLIFLIIPTLLAPGLLVYQMFTGQLGEFGDGIVVAAASTTLVLLVLARGAGLLVIAERRSHQLEGALNNLRDALADRERSNAELNHRVTTDHLTGLANRSYFVTALEHSLASRSETSIAFFDMDDFKSINDTLGHEAGDLLLVDLARRLTQLVGPGDLVARFGGDEFAVLANGDVAHLAEELLRALQQPMLLDGRELLLKVSIGVTTSTATESPSSGDLLRRADIAMYTAKRSGGGWARYQAGMSEVLRERMDLQARLTVGLRRGEIKPWFQPIVDLTSGDLRGFEALARWVPDGGIPLVPAEWLPIAEETGLVVAVDRAVCHAAFLQLATWRAQHRMACDLHLAINLSGRTLQQPGVAQDLIEMLSELGVPANRIIVEVNEGVLIDDPRVSARLQTLRSAGIRVALDDFGTGWSSLSYLQKFPVDLLKLDRSFTSELGFEPGAAAIPAAVIQLARAMSLGVIAEGVETAGQVEHLLDLGFNQAQGYLFARAHPPEDLEELLQQQQPNLGAVVAPVADREVVMLT